MSSDDEVARAVRDLVLAGDRYRGEVGRSAGLGPSAVTTLALLYLEGPATPGRIARHLGITTASATQLLDRLEAAEHVRRRPNPADRRSCLVELRPAGHRYVAATYGDFRERIHRVVAGLPGEDVAAVAGFLRAASNILAGPGVVAG
ncbi:MarR family winged helix-turn-helix transcriptional regulator [Pseudonocardia yuanmonensis]|uniref:MarR family winged helix-turn-helix transcriptional regulator n=1 Tax=Pseudonocardia yuanmonensis TaxID=1095914 RepID=A0ABP8W3U4_9PSEU